MHKVKLDLSEKSAEALISRGGNLECVIGEAVKAELPAKRRYSLLEVAGLLSVTCAVLLTIAVCLFPTSKTIHVTFGDSEKHLSEAQLNKLSNALSGKTDINLRYGEKKHTIANVAVNMHCSYATIKSLIKLGCDINGRGYWRNNKTGEVVAEFKGNTVLMQLIYDGRYWESMRLLEDFPDIDVNIQNALGSTALKLCLKRQSIGGKDRNLDLLINAIEQRKL